MHHIIGITPGLDAFVAYKWIIIWLLVCGSLICLALLAPPWLEVPEYGRAPKPQLSPEPGTTPAPGH